MNLAQLLMRGPKMGRPMPDEWAKYTPKQQAAMMAKREEAERRVQEIADHLRQYGEMSNANLAADFKLSANMMHTRCARGVDMGLLIKATRWTENRRGAGNLVTFWRAA